MKAYKYTYRQDDRTYTTDDDEVAIARRLYLRATGERCDDLEQLAAFMRANVGTEAVILNNIDFTRPYTIL